MSTTKTDYVDEMNKVSVRRLHRAKLRMTCYLFAVGGFGRYEREREGQAGVEERDAYGTLYSRLARELVDAYREAFMTGTLVHNKALQRECLDWFYGQRVSVMQALDMNHTVGSWLEVDEEAFRKQLQEAVEGV